MSVYTSVSEDEMRTWLAHYTLGELIELKGIQAGITNTNYFVTTTTGRYVLTLFETLKLHEIPYYLELMLYLSKHGVACPTPIVNDAEELVSLLADKPACLVSCLVGQDEANPNLEQCYSVGYMLALMHKVGQSFPQRMSNPRGPAWWAKIAHRLYPKLSAEDRLLLKEELALQEAFRFQNLPNGVIHADLFRDNVLLSKNKIAGFIDFYYACNDILIYDLAIAINDWAQNADHTLNPDKIDHILKGYEAARNLSTEEKAALPTMLRAAGLRFWLSRLLDFHEPQVGEMTYIKDPNVFKQIILQHKTLDICL